MLFYAATAPVGWTIDSNRDDKLVYVTSGGSAAETGGTSCSSGSWTISGLTATGGGHVHQWYNNVAAGNDQSYDSGGSAQSLSVGGEDKGAGDVHVHLHVAASAMGDMYTTSVAPGTMTISQDASWRVAAYNFILCEKD